MQPTRQDLTVQTVADGRASAMAWLARRLRWEARLQDLDARRGQPAVAAETTRERTRQKTGRPRRSPDLLVGQAR